MFNRINMKINTKMYRLRFDNNIGNVHEIFSIYYKKFEYIENRNFRVLLWIRDGIRNNDDRFDKG